MGHPNYYDYNSIIVPIGFIGTITHIRYFYERSSNEYKEYKVSFIGFSDGQWLVHIYNDSWLEPV
jgi:hypothetical protein